MLSEQHEQWQYERMVAQQRWPRARTEARNEAYQAALRGRKGTSEDRERANQAAVKADRRFVKKIRPRQSVYRRRSASYRGRPSTVRLNPSLRTEPWPASSMLEFRTSPFPTRWSERSLPPADPFSVERRDRIAEQIRCDNGEARWRLPASTALRIIELLARRDCP
jgi:hypothetical protein